MKTYPLNYLNENTVKKGSYKTTLLKRKNDNELH